MSNGGTVKNIRIIGFCFAIIIIVSGLIWWQNEIRIEKAFNDHQEQVSETILKTINEQARLDLFMPEIVFIEIDSIKKSQLRDSISSQIASILTEKYMERDKTDLKKDDLDFQPFFVLPEKNWRGDYTLTANQMAELRNHIRFLTEQTDKAVKSVKEEMSNELVRLNTWVGIWIGVLAIFGAIVPLFYNFKGSEGLREIKANASKAEEKAEAAHGILKKHEKSLEKVEQVGSELTTIKANYEGLKTDIKSAKDDSAEATEKSKEAYIKAQKVEQLLTVLNDVSKLKDIDATYLLYQPEPLKVMISYLEEIHGNLEKNSGLHQHPTVKDIFRQLAWKLPSVALKDFISPKGLGSLNTFSFETSKLLEGSLTQENFNKIMEQLSLLIASLKDSENTNSNDKSNSN